MSLVTLIKSADTTLRDAVVQVEDWALPKEAVATGKIDADGRAVFTVLKTEEAKVVAEIKKEEPVANTLFAKVETEVKTVVAEGESEVEKFVHEIEADAKSVAAKVEGFFHKDTK